MILFCLHQTPHFRQDLIPRPPYLGLAAEGQLKGNQNRKRMIIPGMAIRFRLIQAGRIVLFTLRDREQPIWIDSRSIPSAIRVRKNSGHSWSFSKARMTIFSISTGTSAPSCFRDFGCWWNRIDDCLGMDPWERKLPREHFIENTTPSDQTSVRWSTASPRTCSGDM